MYNLLALLFKTNTSFPENTILTKICKWKSHKACTKNQDFLKFYKISREYQEIKTKFSKLRQYQENQENQDQWTPCSCETLKNTIQSKISLIQIVVTWSGFLLLTSEAKAVL